MATNNGACSNETAGTATLIIFSGVSAEKLGVSEDSKKTVRETKIQRVMSRSFSNYLKTPITPSERKSPARFLASKLLSTLSAKSKNVRLSSQNSLASVQRAKTAPHPSKSSYSTICSCSKIGNSLALRNSKPLAEDAELKEGTVLNLDVFRMEDCSHVRSKGSCF